MSVNAITNTNSSNAAYEAFYVGQQEQAAANQQFAKQVAPTHTGPPRTSSEITGENSVSGATTDHGINGNPFTLLAARADIGAQVAATKKASY